MARKLPGLYWNPATGEGSIDKRVPGTGRVRHRFKAGSAQEAEAEYHRAIAAAREPQGSSEPTFRAAAVKYLTEETKPSLPRDAQSLEILDPYIGPLKLSQVHQGSLQVFIDQRRAQGVKSSTVSRDLAVVRRILTLASRVWRTAEDRPWLTTAPPLIRMPEWDDEAKPYPLTWDEQRAFLRELPAHLAAMALFAVNTGCRDAVVCGLRWTWQQQAPELGEGATVFVVPGRETKSGLDQVIVLNRTARSVIDGQRGQHPDYVFTFKGRRIGRMLNTAWKSAWTRAGLPDDPGILGGPHNLRHTFARRLRLAGVSNETRKVLMHHADGDITTHYSPAELRELLTAVEAIEDRGVTMLRAVK